MNKAILIGRLTRDPEVRTLNSGSLVCNFTLAIDRRSKGEETADFINCETWGKSAENMGRWMHKGRQIAVEGRIQVDSYDKDGERRYRTKVVCDRIEFLGKASEADQQEPPKNNAVDNQTEYGQYVSFSDEDLPF